MPLELARMQRPLTIIFVSIISIRKVPFGVGRAKVI